MATTVRRWDPFLSDLADLRDRLDRAFGEMTADDERTWSPRVDLVREEDRMVLHADIPGLKPEEVDISVEDGTLTISGKHEESSEEKGKRFVRRERRYGSFSRSMPLPTGVDPDKIEAEIADGVLEVTIPTAPVEKPKRVEIKPRGA